MHEAQRAISEGRRFYDGLKSQSSCCGIALVQRSNAHKRQRIIPGDCTGAIRSRACANRQGAAEQQVCRRAARGQLQSAAGVARSKAASRSLRGRRKGRVKGVTWPPNQSLRIPPNERNRRREGHSTIHGAPPQPQHEKRAEGACIHRKADLSMEFIWLHLKLRQSGGIRWPGPPLSLLRSASASRSTATCQPSSDRTAFISSRGASPRLCSARRRELEVSARAASLGWIPAGGTPHGGRGAVSTDGGS